MSCLSRIHRLPDKTLHVQDQLNPMRNSSLKENHRRQACEEGRKLQDAGVGTRRPAGREGGQRL